MLDLITDSELFRREVESFGASDEQFERARLSALRKMRKTIRSRIIRSVAKEEKIPQKALSGRIYFSSLDKGAEELETWIGTWDVYPDSIGKPVQNSRGVRVGKRSYPGAFIGKIYSLQEKVWIRLYSRHYSPALYPTKYRPGDRGIGSSRGRFPVVRAAIPIDGIVRTVMANSEDHFARQFEKTFIRELNYQVNIRGKMQ